MNLHYSHLRTAKQIQNMSTQNLYKFMELVDQKEGISRKILFFYQKKEKPY